MGIQFNQIDNLQSYFDSVSGNLQSQITAFGPSIYDMASGTFGFQGIKYFEGNVDFSGAQGILINPNNVYTPNTVFAGALKIGGGIASPRNTTTAPEGVMQVTGGASYFEGNVHIRNNGQLNALAIDASSITAGTGQFYQTTGTFVDYTSGSFSQYLLVGGDAYLQRAYITGSDGNWMQITGGGGGGGGGNPDAATEAFALFTR